jgi:subtilisin family serine protease
MLIHKEHIALIIICAWNKKNKKIRAEFTDTLNQNITKMFAITILMILAALVAQIVTANLIIESRVLISGSDLIAVRNTAFSSVFVQTYQCIDCEQARIDFLKNPNVLLVEDDVLVPQPSTLAVPLDRVSDYMSETIYPDIVSNYSEHITNKYLWGLDSLDGQLDGTYNYNFLANNITVYVLDSGYDPTGDELVGRLKPGVSFVNGDSSTVDCNGHGSHVANTIASTTYGVAKNVTIVPVRIYPCEGGTVISNFLKGLYWIIADAENATKNNTKNNTGKTKGIINISSGGGFNQIVNNAIKAAFDAGFVVIVAAGNDGLNSCGFSPSSSKPAITVGCYNITGGICSFSNEGTCVDIFAPGELILSMANFGAPLVLSGTSMSTPHVTGVICILFQLFPNWSPQQLADLLISIATRGSLKGFKYKGSPNLKLKSILTKPSTVNCNKFKMRRCHNTKQCTWTKHGCRNK